ncbi:MAG TPA: DUF1641 domain-containing protein [Usitatibacter sp.]|nr:DUF1641 domain-containing protein [Usitatibacter sp.]
MNDVTDKAAPSDELESLLRAARDSVSDDMIARLTENASQGLELMDRVNRSGVADALPAIAALVRSGDLERLTHYARMLGAAEDALTDDMIGRFANLAGEGTLVLDRLNRSGVTQLIALLDQMNSTGALDRIAAKLPVLVDNLETIERLLHCVAEASKEVTQVQPPGGGLMSLLGMLRDPENQKAIQFGLALGRRLRKGGA